MSYIIVRQDYDRPTLELWPEHPLAGSVEVVAIDQAVCGHSASSSFAFTCRGDRERHDAPDLNALLGIDGQCREGGVGGRQAPVAILGH